VSDTVGGVSLVETVLVFVVIPAGIYGVVALLTLRVRASKTPRYRPGQDWDHPPVWWTANPDGAAHPVQVDGEESVAAHARTAWGGARGSW
jgi:Tfp pilus assembly protein PilV